MIATVHNDFSILEMPHTPVLDDVGVDCPIIELDRLPVNAKALSPAQIVGLEWIGGWEAITQLSPIPFVGRLGPKDRNLDAMGHNGGTLWRKTHSRSPLVISRARLATCFRCRCSPYLLGRHSVMRSQQEIETELSNRRKKTEVKRAAECEEKLIGRNILYKRWKIGI
jgi:hypothetical protein